MPIYSNKSGSLSLMLDAQQPSATNAHFDKVHTSFAVTK